MKKGINNKGRPDKPETYKTEKYKPEKSKKLKKPLHLNGRGKHAMGFVYN